MLNRYSFNLIFVSVLLFTSDGITWADSNWPQFRGANSTGVATGKNLPDRWSSTENIAWKADIPGRGWSSPIVWGDQIFLTSVINSGQSEEPKKGLYFGGERPKPPEAIHQWKVFSLQLSSGKILWQKTVHQGIPLTPIHIKSSYASETPVTDGERLYCYFGNLGVFCLDLNGNELWNKKLPPQPTRLGWGTAASPVLHKNRLYIVNDNNADSYLLALDSKTGKEVFRIPRDEKSNWASPYIWQNNLRTEIITPGTGRIRSYDLDGKLLWSLKGMSSITIATPFQHNGLLYLSSGYVMDLQRPIYAIKPGASGDISLSDNAKSNPFIAWCGTKAAPYNPSSIAYRDNLYVLYDRGQVACFNANDGKEIYSAQRLEKGRAFTSSPWAYDDKIFCVNEDGLTFVLKAGDKFELLHINSLASDDMCMATPAIAGDRLIIRTSARIYCVQSKVSKVKEKTIREQTVALTFNREIKSIPDIIDTKNDPADWAMYNHDVRGWRFNSAEKSLSSSNVNQLIQKWQFPLAGSKEVVGVIHATPTVVKGEVYFGTTTFPAFYKLAANGTTLWVYRNPDHKNPATIANKSSGADKLTNTTGNGGILSSALVHQGAVYFADVDGWFYALGADKGTEIWKINSRAANFPDSHWNNLSLGSPIFANGFVIFSGGTLEQAFAGTTAYPGSTGRSFIMAIEPKSGKISWKFNVGPKPQKLDPPVVIDTQWGKYKFDFGPATSSVWSTPSYDPDTNTLFFGTDVNTAPRQPTPDNPAFHTEDSCAIVAIDASTGLRKWNTQINAGDVWTNSMPAYDPKTGLYKDNSIGDTPKIYSIDIEGTITKVVGVGCKNGGF